MFPLRTLICVFALLFCDLFANTARAQNDSKNQPPRQLVEIAARQDLPPYVEENASSGIEIDLVRAVFNDSPFEPVFIQQPRVRMISAFENRELEGILTQNILASNVGCVTDWYIAHQNVAKTIADRHIAFEGLEGLEGHSVLSFSGATRYLGPDFLQAIKKTKRYTESGDQAKHIALLYKNRFDIVVGDSWILALAQKRYFAETGSYLKLESHPIMAPSLYVARFHDPAICEAFDSGLRRLRASGEYAEIWNGYEKQLMVAGDSAHHQSPLKQ